MTKLRTPDSIEDAVRQADALLGAGAISVALSSPALGMRVSESLITKWGDPDAIQKIGLHHALAIDLLLIKAGHAPIFIELFKLLLPMEPAAEADETPVVAAMRTTSEAAQVMDRIDQAMADGQLEPHEVITCRAGVERLQKRIAKLKRTLFFKPPAKR